MTPTYYTLLDGKRVPVFVDRPQRDGNTYPDTRYEVYVADEEQVARLFRGKAASVPCAVPEPVKEGAEGG